MEDEGCGIKFAGFTVYYPCSYDGEYNATMVALTGTCSAYMELVDRSNEVSALIDNGKLREAATLLRYILDRKPAAGFDNVSLALTQHELGTVLRQLGELDNALELLMQAFVVRDHADENLGIVIALRDGNLTREEIAKVYEAKGNCAKALDVRQRGKRICSNDVCEALDYKDDELFACSRCKCVFYCGKTCQRQDWKNRHRPMCQQPMRQI
ncbi:uncharacterized protein CCR75_007431 [Bremia lactucae]|uniref:phytol kinase n=1 Tax=Bremia lactucae TaxID=4779 RepID=A0A976FJC4_BRELC|nr:hypothetical protein CCR75_007431 [Bremia lactucae]